MTIVGGPTTVKLTLVAVAVAPRLFVSVAVMTYEPGERLRLPEAAVLLGEAVAEDEAGAAAQARRLVALGARAVLIKGGHGNGAMSVDHLVTADGHTQTFAAPRLTTKNTHEGKT